MIDSIISVVGEEVFARTVLALIGIVFGAVPMIFGIIRKMVPVGIFALLVCGVVSGIGLPYISPLIAGLACYAIVSISDKKRREGTEQNRKQFFTMLNKERETGKIREREYIDNNSAANEAWPPVSKSVDKDALSEYEKMMQAENEAHRRSDRKKESDET